MASAWSPWACSAPDFTPSFSHPQSQGGVGTALHWITLFPIAPASSHNRRSGAGQLVLASPVQDHALQAVSKSPHSLNLTLRGQRRVGRHHRRTAASLGWPRLLLALLARPLAGGSHEESIPPNRRSGAVVDVESLGDGTGAKRDARTGRWTAPLSVLQVPDSS